MVDFFIIATKSVKQGGIAIYPKFIIGKSSDLMIRGGDFYAIWIEERGLWSTNEQDAIDIIDRELDKYAKENKHIFEDHRVRVLHMWDAETGMIDAWHKYCQKQQRDSYNMLDETLMFSNGESQKNNYASKRLNYPLEEGTTDAYDKLMSTLYSDKERHKIEWCIGAVVTGESKRIQKFLVLYGAGGTGKSTVLNIIQMLFDGYYSVFDSKALGSSTNSFALEAFKNNPLVAIQHDGDLSKIEDNTRLNSLVSHELMTVNEKFKSTYSNRFVCFLFMGTNKPVKITDGRSGILRRLIDVSPTGNKLSAKEYNATMKQIEFELGAIAYKCKQIYLSNTHAYDDYIPIEMYGASNDFYNYIIDSYSVFKKENGTTLKSAWEMYKVYCDEAKVPYPFSQRVFKEELKNYFKEFDDKINSDDGSRIRNYYSGFRTEKFESVTNKKEQNKQQLIVFKKQESIFDVECADCQAQYATDDGLPLNGWDYVNTKVSDIDTSKLHYVRVPENHIVIDFDIKDETGAKSFSKNIEEASKWPATYAELSKSGGGIHLHYIYSGDITKLSRIYSDDIEVKVFTGKQSLRRKLTKCNDVAISTISSGLPLKGEKMINVDVVQSEKGIRTTIKKCLNKEVHAGTKCNVDFIYKILDDYYTSGNKYDVSDLYNDVLAFAAGSTHQADYCIKLVNKMHFKSDEISIANESSDDRLVFYDVEVFPNLFIVNWKFQGESNNVIRMINPSSKDIEGLIKFKLVGFNCRRYDNHILYASLMGYTNEKLYKLSQKIINSNKGEKNNGTFGEAYNLSYTDIYDFASSGNKKSLKKLEIEMGIHHQELGIPWDKPVPQELWVKVAEYCDNDVIATEAAFNYLSPDWTARQILADLADLTVNDTTNALTTKIIFDGNKNPQNQFNYRDLSKPVSWLDYDKYINLFGEDYIFNVFDSDGQPTYETYTPETILPDGWSILPFFPGYKYENGVSIYRGEEVGEGGYVYAEPGIHINAALLDVASMHPHSVIAEVLFGKKFTKAFKDIVDGRVNIKHESWAAVDSMLNGKLKPYIEKVKNKEMTAKQLADALKTAINSVYGLTSANFDNPFRDIRNKDNIVAKRGALFMINLKHEVQNRGFTVAHIKTDSIKIPNATPEIIQFVMDYGKVYGYTFEHEATYERMCLVNNAVYIARYDTGEWSATGTQFAVPYVFKKLFTKEPIVFDDLCETKSVKTAIYLDFNEDLPDVSALEKELFVITKGNREPERQEELKKLISSGHNYKFVGKVGNFCPIKQGKGGALLVREGVDKNGDIKYDAVNGTKDYRWLESEMVKTLNKEDDIDLSYYNKLVDEAIYGKVVSAGKRIPGISDFGDYEWFISDDSCTKQ